MKSEPNLEAYNEKKHGAILMAAALEGVDITPVVGGSERYVGFGDTTYGYGPTGILDIVGTEHVAEPHVTWFPWTTNANKVVNFKWAMLYLSKTREILITVEKAQMNFFEHFVKKGLLRKIGYLENLPIVEEIHMYQYRRKTQ